MYLSDEWSYGNNKAQKEAQELKERGLPGHTGGQGNLPGKVGLSQGCREVDAHLEGLFQAGD